MRKLKDIPQLNEQKFTEYLEPLSKIRFNYKDEDSNNNLSFIEISELNISANITEITPGSIKTPNIHIKSVNVTNSGAI